MPHNPLNKNELSSLLGASVVDRHADSAFMDLPFHQKMMIRQFGIRVVPGPWRVEMAEDRTVAVIGASRDRAKFGNKAVRAYRSDGWTVYPINPAGEAVEGLQSYASIRDVPGAVKRALLYVPPHLVDGMLDDIASKGVQEIFFNPGTESPAAMQRARELALDVHARCAIVAIGRSPDHPD
jgi:predicted CoA-binding protein